MIATQTVNTDPTLIEYDLGAGHVLASSQPYDFGFDNGEDTGLILVNGVPYTYNKAISIDAPWLTESPTAGTVATGDSQAITVSVDSTGLAPGVYRAAIRIRTNDPDNARILVPVTLVVPEYQQGVNAGGNAYVDPNTGDAYASDRAFSAGGFGYVGGQARSNPARSPEPTAIRSTRICGRACRPTGSPSRTASTRSTWRSRSSSSRRPADASSASRWRAPTVVSDLDVFAAAGGQHVAYDQSFIVEVTDGVLDIGFIAQRGDQPIVNGILVTELPPGALGD